MFPLKQITTLRRVNDGFMQADHQSSESDSPFESDAKNWILSHLKKLGENVLENFVYVIQIAALCYLASNFVIQFVMWIVSLVYHFFAYGPKHKLTKQNATTLILMRSHIRALLSTIVKSLDSPVSNLFPFILSFEETPRL